MSQKLASVKQQIITIEKPFGGWGAQKNTPGSGSQYPIEATDSEYSLSSFINLYRSNTEGYLAPGECFQYQLTDSNSRVTQLPVAAASLDVNYAVLADNRVVQFTSSSVSATNYWDTAGHGGHSSQSSNSSDNDIVTAIDLAVSPNLGYVFYSWEDATDGDIGVITHNVTGGSYSQTYNWFSGLSGSGALQAGVPRKMKIGTDGNLYCTNGQYIAQAVLVGNIFGSATGSAQKLNLGNSYVAASLIPFQSYLIIIGNLTADSYAVAQFPRVRIWFWDYADANPNFVFDLDDYSGLSVIVDQDGTLNAITAGKDSMTTTWVYNGSTFQKKFQASTTSISSPTHSQVDIFNGNVHFMGSNSVNQWDGNGFHNALGYLNLNNLPNPVLGVGFLKNIDTLYAGFHITSAQSGYSNVYGIWSLIDLSNHITYAPNAYFYDKLRVLGYRGRVVAIRLYFAQFGTGASFKVSMYNGYDTATDLVARTITYSSGTDYNCVVIPINFILDSLWCAFLWNHSSVTATAAILRKAEIVVEPTDFKN
jgi:hypothetical protein